MNLGIGLMLGSRQSVTAPSLNFELSDTAGGDAITVTAAGRGLTSATVTVGGTGATVTGSGPGTITFTQPAKAAGVYSVVVTPVSGPPLALSIEAWAPDTEPGCTLFCERPSYASAGGNGTWTARVGTAPTQATSAPAATGGAPLFDGTTVLDGPLMGTLFGTTTGGAFSTVVNATAPGAPNPGAPFAERGLFADKLFGALGAGYSTDGFRIWATDGVYKNAVVPMSPVGFHAAVGRFKDSDFVEASVDGSPFASASTAIVGARNNGGAGLVMIVGNNYSSAINAIAEMRALVAHNTKPSDAYAGKFYKWARARHGVS